MRKPVLTVTFIVAGLVPAANAFEYCVECQGPDAIYRCAVEGENSSQPSTRGQVRCISDLAKTNGHQTCSIKRTRTGPCEGELKVVKVPNDQVPGAVVGKVVPPPDVETPPGTMLAPSIEPPEGPPSADPNDVAGNQPPPVEEPKDENAITSAAKAAGKSIEKAGDAVGDAARKSWDCVASLFRGC